MNSTAVNISGSFGIGFSGYESDSINWNAVAGVIFSASALIMSVLSIFLISFLENGAVSNQGNNRWWRIFKVVVIVDLVLSIIGTQQTIEAWRIYMVMTQPNRYLEESGCGGSKYFTIETGNHNFHNYWYTQIVVAQAGTLSVVVVSLVISTMASAAKYWTCTDACETKQVPKYQ